MKNKLLEEKKYHDLQAKKYSQDRIRDFIWEIPEELFLLKNKYFKNKVVLDMGCGPAISIIRIIPKEILFSCRYIGVDISNQMIQLAKKNIPTGVFIVSDISKKIYKEEAVDTLLSLGALHHSLNKDKTIINWAKYIKKEGYLLFREPTYEVLKEGTGASPFEEGIKIFELIGLLKKLDFQIECLIFFNSNFFHFFNKIFIKLFKNNWSENKIYWYYLIIVDIFVSNTLGKLIYFFRGGAFILIAKKL